MLCTFSFGCFQIYQNKSAKNIGIYFIRIIVPMKCMPKISAVGLYCLDKFEKSQTRTCTTFFRTSKLTEVYFKKNCHFVSFLKRCLKQTSYSDKKSTLEWRKIASPCFSRGFCFDVHSSLQYYQESFFSFFYRCFCQRRKVGRSSRRRLSKVSFTPRPKNEGKNGKTFTLLPFLF